MDVAREHHVSPWDALLLGVRLAAGRVAWTDAQLRDAVAEHADEPAHPAVLRWLRESREERTHMSRAAKSAIDAGVAERLVRQVELEGEIVAQVLGRVLDALDLPEDRRLFAFEEAKRTLLELESG